MVFSYNSPKSLRQTGWSYEKLPEISHAKKRAFIEKKKRGMKQPRKQNESAIR